MEIILAALALALGYVGAVAAESHARHNARVQLRRMVHDERIRAMDKGIPIDEIPEELPEWMSDAAASGSWLRIVRISALAIGLVLLLGGTGALAGLTLAGDDELNKVWSMSLIPIMAGIGLLLFHRLTRAA